MSIYLDPNKALQRLRDDWNKHGSIIVAVDYDSTLVPYLPHENGGPFHLVHQLVRTLKEMGCTIIIFTASAQDRWDDIKHNLTYLNIKYDLFNESPAHIPNIGKNGKVYANAYLDDRAGLYEVYTMLTQLVAEKRLEQIDKAFQGLSKQLSRP